MVNTQHGCTDSITKTFQSYPLPGTRFVVDSAKQCLTHNSFSFVNTTVLNIDSISTFKWYSSAGDSSQTTNYQRQFTTVDSFFILLVAQTNHNCIDSFSWIVETIESPKAIPWFSATNLCERDEVINLSDSSVPTNSIDTRGWYIDSQWVSADSSITHVFNQPGNHEVNLTVSHLNGCKDTAVNVIVVHPKPEAVMHISNPEQCLTGNTFQFLDSSTLSNDSVLSSRWYFGNGDSSTNSTTSYTYGKADSLWVVLISQSDRKCRDTARSQVVVHPQPQVDFAIDTNQLCLRNNQFRFTNGSTVKDSKLNYTWNLGNDTSVDVNPIHTFNSFGTKLILLIGTSSFGCIDSLLDTVQVHPMPLSRPFVNDTAQCLNTQFVVLSDSSTIPYGNLSTIWVLYNAQTRTSPQTQVNFSQAGFYTHVLISTSDETCADTVSISHTILPLPDPDFSLKDSTLCLDDQPFELTAISGPETGIMNYLWDFGDSGTDTLRSPVHIYAQAGLYKIRLVAVSDRLCRDTSELEVEVYHKPKAILNANALTQCFNQQNFRFTGSSTVNSGTIEGYIWETGTLKFNGNKDTALSFANPGKHDIIYVAVTNHSCLDTTRLEITINPNPVSSFTINDSIQCANNNGFDFKSTSILSSGTLTHQWFFDQTYFSSGPDVTRIFANADTLTVMLIDTSGEGCRDSALGRIYVAPTPQVLFSVNDIGQCLNANNFIFTNNSQIVEGTLTYNWDFGDGNGDTKMNTNHLFADHGDYTTRLIAISDRQCADTLDQLMLVHPEPTAQFTVNDYGQCLRGNNFTTVNQSTIDSTTISFKWSWGDANTDTDVSPEHIYSTVGNYLILLVTTSEYGCVDSFSKPAVVNQMPVAKFGVNYNVQCINEQNFVFTNQSFITQGNLLSHRWSIDNQVVDNVSPLTYVFAKSGNERISLRVTSDSLCMDTVAQSVRIYPKPEAGITILDSVQCLFENDFEYTSISTDSFGIISNHWRYKGVNRTGTTFEIKYSTPGLKNVRLVSTSVNKCRDTTEIDVLVKPMPDPRFGLLKKYYCEDEDSSILVPNQAGGIFYGKNIINQKYIPRILWKDTVIYVVSLDDCWDSSFQTTNVYPLPNFDLGNDTTLCKFETLTLDAGESWESSYVWQDTSSNSKFKVTKAGRYFVTATNICGVLSDTITVGMRDINCRFFLPTAFRPNNDGLNDLFRPVTFNVDHMTYQIFNTWGERIYEGDVNDPGWDGTYMGHNSPMGCYVIIVSYSYLTNARIIEETISSVFHLMR